jgi:hypothetical protein
MRGKPIQIVRVTHGYNMFVNDVPVVSEGKGVSLDRAKAGLKTSQRYKPPTDDRPKLISKASDVASLAHQIGRYLLGMGDFVSGYTELVGVPGNHDDWWEKALR